MQENLTLWLLPLRPSVQKGSRAEPGGFDTAPLISGQVAADFGHRQSLRRRAGGAHAVIADPEGQAAAMAQVFRAALVMIEGIGGLERRLTVARIRLWRQRRVGGATVATVCATIPTA